MLVCATVAGLLLCCLVAVIDTLLVAALTCCCLPGTVAAFTFCLLPVATLPALLTGTPPLLSFFFFFLLQAFNSCCCCCFLLLIFFSILSPTNTASARLGQLDSDSAMGESGPDSVFLNHASPNRRLHTESYCPIMRTHDIKEKCYYYLIQYSYMVNQILILQEVSQSYCGFSVQTRLPHID